MTVTPRRYPWRWKYSPPKSVRGAQVCLFSPLGFQPRHPHSYPRRCVCVLVCEATQRCVSSMCCTSKFVVFGTDGCTGARVHWNRCMCMCVWVFSVLLRTVAAFADVLCRVRRRVVLFARGCVWGLSSARPPALLRENPVGRSPTTMIRGLTAVHTFSIARPFVFSSKPWPLMPQPPLEHQRCSCISHRLLVM